MHAWGSLKRTVIKSCKIAWSCPPKAFHSDFSPILWLTEIRNGKSEFKAKVAVPISWSPQHSDLIRPGIAGLDAAILDWYGVRGFSAWPTRFSDRWSLCPRTQCMTHQIQWPLVTLGLSCPQSLSPRIDWPLQDSATHIVSVPDPKPTPARIATRAGWGLGTRLQPIYVIDNLTE